MKKRLGILLIAILAVQGFSEAIAAQHVEEAHSNRHAHGPPRSDSEIIREEHHNSRNQHLNRLCDR